FLHPRVIENIYKIIDILDSRISKVEVAQYFNRIQANQIELVTILKKYEGKGLPKGFRDQLDDLRVLNNDAITSSYSEEERALDIYTLSLLKAEAKKIVQKNKTMKKDINKLLAHIED